MEVYEQITLCPIPKEEKKTKFRKCTVCGMNFEKNHKRTVCSPECYIQRRKDYYKEYNKIKNRACIICKNKIEGHGLRKFCSVKCQYVGELMARKIYKETSLKQIENT